MDHKDKNHSPFFSSMTLAAIGVVFGDIGTSPLYAIKEAFHGSHGMPLTPENIFGVISLVFWSIIVVISIKYLGFVLKADNKGEGGVLALTALVFPAHKTQGALWHQRLTLYLGLFGAALLVGDGMITPAISVLSAMEGLSIATPLLSPYILLITILVLSVLFFYQYHGTARLGSVFGVIVTLWFCTIGALGIYGILGSPEILQAANPLWAVDFFRQHRWGALFVLGAVFLVATGGEALYADMGHFGRKPIEKAWFFVAMPALILNYFGQGALLLSSPEHASHPFYHLAPSWGLYPLVALATMATVIASQAVISGVFSMVRQAIQLGYTPRFRMVHTSEEEVGQIYFPQINWWLFAMVCWLVLEFRSSSALASAYGMAVATTMVITTILAAIVAVRLWKWPVWKIGLLLCLLVPFDIVFLLANFSKFHDGGWFPLLIGGVIFTLMTTWRRGRSILFERLQEKSVPFSSFIKQITHQPPASVKGIAVFMTGDPSGTPPALLHNLRHNRVLHETNILMTITTLEVPFVSRQDRVQVEILEEGFFRVTAQYGFAQSPSIRGILYACNKKHHVWPMNQITFFLGRETLIPTDRPGMARWRESLFAFMSKNAERATHYFDIPSDQVVEVGLQVEL
jgi:KUP system potassium uptake protein